jgi:predicted nucleic acid-binding protein
LTTSSTPIEPIYAVDTNALIWYLTTNKKLSKRAANIFAAAENGETRIYVSAMVIAEMYYANKKWELFEDFAQTYADLRAKPYLRFVPLNADDVLDFDKDSSVPEMHNRIISGVARRLGCALLTSDPLIIASGIVAVVW